MQDQGTDLIDPTRFCLLTRVFLACDGTLTRLVEAAFREPVALHVHSQTIDKEASYCESLDLASQQTIMQRAIILKGARTGRHFVYAESSTAIDRLPPSFSGALLDKQITIGELWRTHANIITKREALTVRLATKQALVGLFHPAPDLVMRSYRVFVQNAPVMVISEYFPFTYQEI